jgi:hypothetical protein
MESGQKKIFKYYAIRVGNMIMFRRTINTLKKVRSVLYKPGTEFRIEQITYSGGQAVGCMSYNDWATHGGKRLNSGMCSLVSRETYRSLGPYITTCL